MTLTPIFDAVLAEHPEVKLEPPKVRPWWLFLGSYTVSHEVGG